MATRTTPRYVVEDEALKTVERKLGFHRLGVSHPRRLTREQIERFNRDGYLKGIRVFEEDEISGVRRYFDGLLAKVLAAGEGSYSIFSAHLKHAGAYDLLTHPRIVALARDLLGDDVIGWGCHFFCKLPGDGKVIAWHQDASYWPLSPTKTVTFWLAIDDADVENACMRFIPGSHLLGHLTYELTEDDEPNVLTQRVPNAEQLGAPVDVELQAGEVSLHSDLLLHSSGMNDSQRRRCGVALRFCSAEVRAGLGWNARGVVVSGRDEAHHWANPPRPAE